MGVRLRRRRGRGGRGRGARVRDAAEGRCQGKGGQEAARARRPECRAPLLAEGRKAWSSLRALDAHRGLPPAGEEQGPGRGRLPDDRPARVLHPVQLPDGHDDVPRVPQAPGRRKRRPREALMLIVDRYELGPIGTNGYVVRSSREAGDAVVVDPGGDAAMLRLELARMGAACAAILITHTHWDHLGAVADLAEGTGAPVYAPERERPVLERPGDYYPGVSIRSWSPEHTLEGGETVELAGIPFEVISVPGHSPGHLAYYADGCLFSGDVLFAGSVGRTDLPYSDWDTLLGSLRRLLERFPPETVVYPGHGPETTLGGELERNPFLAELRAG